MQSDKLLREKYDLLLPHLDEKSKRLYLASESIGYGRGGISKTAKLTGFSRVTLTSGIKELRSADPNKIDLKRNRKAGGGRKKLIDKEVGLIEAVRELVSPHTVGDPMNTLLWTSKSTRKISEELKRKGYNVSYNVVNRILSSEGFSLQGNKKVDEGGEHEDRDAQFEHINKMATEFIALGDPVISVDCKKKELVGNYKNSGQEWHPRAKPPKLRLRFYRQAPRESRALWGVRYRAKPRLGERRVNYDTAKFAVSSIRNWWYEMGQVCMENQNAYS
jgi:transposase